MGKPPFQLFFCPDFFHQCYSFMTILISAKIYQAELAKAYKMLALRYHPVHLAGKTRGRAFAGIQVGPKNSKHNN